MTVHQNEVPRYCLINERKILIKFMITYVFKNPYKFLVVFLATCEFNQDSSTRLNKLLTLKMFPRRHDPF